MARVLLNLSSQPAGKPAGVARFGIELARRLVARGSHRYTFRSQWSPDQLPSEIVEGAAIQVMPPVSNFLKEMLVAWMRAPWAYPPATCDLIVNLDALGLASGGRRRITVVHDIYYASTPEMFSRFARAKQQFIHLAVLGRSHSIVGISEATSSEVRRQFPAIAERVRTIHSDWTMGGIVPGALPEGIMPASYVLAVANVTPNKNFDVLARAFARLAADRPGLRLVHVGEDRAEMFRVELGRRGLADRLVRFSGLGDETLAALYRDALCIAVPSLVEGFCLPLLEAQRFGCPTIYSCRSATGEIGGTGGIAFDPTDDGALEEILRHVTMDPAMRAALTARGYENAARFSWDRATDLYEEAMRDVLNEEGDPRRAPGNGPAATGQGGTRGDAQVRPASGL